MVHASVRGWRLGRALALVVGVLGIFSVLAMTQAGAQTKKAGKKVPAKGPKAPPPLKITITSPGTDVPEMVKVINERLEAGWKANKITPSHYIDDYEFIRRASLDIVGRIARPDEIKAFRNDPADKRRSMLIERLLKSDDYPRHWANMWANWLLTRSEPFGRGKYHEQMTVWLEDQFAQNKPLSEIATKLITAKGSNKDNGAVNFILAHLGDRVPRDKVKDEGHFEMVPLTSRLTRVFLGTQVQCAQCHPHPFYGNLKQEQFWGVNAFLRQVQLVGQRPNLNRMMVRPDLSLVDDVNVNPDATVFYEQRNGKMRMWVAEFLPPSGKERGPRMAAKLKGIARREALAQYIIDHDMFPTAQVNRVWGLFFGRGFVNPIDDFNDNNQPSHPELLKELADRFKHYNYDQKKLIRWITHSNAYHLSYVANKTNDKVEQETQFARMNMKAMSPEQLFESLMVATRADQAETKEAKAKLRADWLKGLITNFGDDEGNEITFNGTIVQALMMMNGKEINAAIARKDKGTVALAVRKGSVPVVINDLYMAALNRPPRPTEVKQILAKIHLRAVRAGKDTPAAAYEDLFWALLNSNEFILNH
jgi:hypothetical protein